MLHSAKQILAHRAKCHEDLVSIGPAGQCPVNSAATGVVFAIPSGDRFAPRSMIAGTASSVPARTILPLVNGNAAVLLAIVRAMIVRPSGRYLAATVAVFASPTHVALLLR